MIIIIYTRLVLPAVKGDARNQAKNIKLHPLTLKSLNRIRRVNLTYSCQCSAKFNVSKRSVPSAIHFSHVIDWKQPLTTFLPINKSSL